MEPELSVHIEMQKIGTMFMTVKMSPDKARQQNGVRFDLDKSYLPDLICGCQSVLVEFPILFKDKKITGSTAT
jgi:hypothetical protein